ncbi:3-hydroxyacyl-CoA dehydrogenase [Bradyrhizobium sp. 187]|uniref:3-hydroxyacyl-CoA dehydrogenase n=1 Tax=Bradyrhizobium sp. 187 TaxID=2782655 RepID=UPI001FFFE1F1|nr:3-hydroxyacyl-CoA dehydrogenase [Bradyrhizobium sp. 187]UPJ71851.1 3-hydroxyacyl-CoA dehydrogenase [Bradyrhizobium sp. 187]
MTRHRNVAVIGVGLIGSAWAIAFARAGWNVRLFDSEQDKVGSAAVWIAQRLSDLESYSLLSESSEAILRRIVCAPSLAEALSGAEYVQESVLEQTGVKRQLFSDLELLLDEGALVGSSSSGIPASAYTGHVSFRDRCLVAHPVNPPYLIPVVELVPAPWTAGATLSSAREIMLDIGQKPVSLSREIEGFVLNRLQGVLLRECFKLVEDGIASVEDLDATVSHGLGIRWSFMGPFETIDLNAPGGVADYAARLGELYRSIASSRDHASGWSADLVKEVERQRRAIVSMDSLNDHATWRDRRLMAMARERIVPMGPNDSDRVITEDDRNPIESLAISSD